MAVRTPAPDSSEAAPSKVRSAFAFWVVVAMTALTLAASGTPSPLYVDYQAQWHFSPIVLTTVYAMYAGGVIVTLLFCGGLSDRIGRRPALLGSVAGLALSLLVFLFATDVIWLYVARALQGLSTGVFTATAGAALTELHVKGDTRKAGLINSAAQSMGTAAGAVLSGALAEFLPMPLRTPYLVLIVAAIVLLVLIARSVPETVTRQGEMRLGALLRPQRLAVPPEARGQFVLGGLGVLAAWSVGGLYLALGGTIAKELLGADNHLIAGLVILCVQGVGGFVSLWFTNASNKVASVVAAAALIAGMGVVSLSLMLGNAPLFLAGDLITGVGFGLGFMGATRRVTQAAPPARRGEMMGAYFVLAYLAISVPATVAGAVSSFLGLANAFYLFAAIMGAVALVSLVCSALSKDEQHA